MHLDDDKLRGFLLGTLEEAQAAAAAVHLETCPDCQETLRSLEAAETVDNLVQLLRTTPQSSDEATGVQRFTARVQSLGEADSAAAEEIAVPEHPEMLGQYQLMEKIGQGGMGIVYKALHQSLKRVVALKMLSRDSTKGDALNRFRREMEAVGRVVHPNMVLAHDAGEVDGQHFLVVEYVEGLDLSEVLRRYGPWRLADACEAIRQAATGLQAAHELDLVHRDVKPSNLMLTASGEIKVLDLGLALLATDEAGEPDLTAVGQLMGTFDYMAPEQASDSHRVDIRADVYSLGGTLYKLLTGQVPLSGNPKATVMQKLRSLALDEPQPIVELRPDLPTKLAKIVHRMLAKSPEDRFPTPQAVAEAVTPFCEEADLAGLLAAAQAETKPAAESVCTSSGTTLPLRLSGTSETWEPEPIAGISGSGRRRWARLGILAGFLGVVLFLGVILIIRDQQGKEKMRIVLEPGDQLELVDSAPAAATARASVEVDRKPTFIKGGDWRIDGPELVQMKPGNAVLLFGDDKWTDYDFSVETLTMPHPVKPGAKKNQGGNHFFRATSQNDHLNFSLGAYFGTANEVCYVKGGRWGRDGTFLNTRHVEDHWYKVRVEVRGSQVRCHLDGKLLFAFKDDRFPTGGIGLATWNSVVRWRNLKVTAPDGKVLWEGFPELPTASQTRPAEAPPPAIAPFDAGQAKTHQQQWADYLGLPVEREITIGQTEKGEDVKLTMVLVPPGEFLMGSTDEERAKVLAEATAAKNQGAIDLISSEGPQHRVRITKPFYLGKYEVTQAQWQSVMGDSPSQFKDNPSHPVEMVEWPDIQPFLTKANDSSSTERMTFRLPTEAQWEYACRAGTMTYWHSGDSERDLLQFGWFNTNAGGKTHPAGQLQPNSWGLHDMHGNVGEWCADPFVADYYANSPTDDPLGPSMGLPRMRRGGSWRSLASGCRSAFRFTSRRTRTSTIGFRLAAEIKVAQPEVNQTRESRVDSMPESRDYDSLAVGTWTPVLRSEKEFQELIVDLPVEQQQKLSYRDGVLECNGSGLRFPAMSGRELIIRARVKYESGQHVSLTMLHPEAEYKAWWNFGRTQFGILRRKKGRGFSDIASRWLPEAPPPFFEYALAAVNGKLIAYVDGKELYQIEMIEAEEQSLIPGLVTFKGVGLFKDIEVMVLDKDQPATKPAKEVDLLARIDPAEDALDPRIRKQNGVLYTGRGRPWNPRVVVPYVDVPKEYRIRMVAERKGDEPGGLGLGFLIEGRHALLELGSGDPPKCGISRIDGKTIRDPNETTVEDKWFRQGHKVTVLLEVRPGRVKVLCSGQKVVDWKGRSQRLFVSKEIALPEQTKLFLYPEAEFAIHELTLTPLDASEAEESPPKVSFSGNPEEVREELRKLNPEFDGAITFLVEGDHVTKWSIIGGTLADLSPLLALEHLKQLNYLAFDPERDAPVLSRMTSLEKINQESAASYRLAYPVGKPPHGVSDQWLQAVANLPLKARTAAVVEKLQELNPNFDGKYAFRDTDLYLKFDSRAVTDLSPLKALPELQQLDCSVPFPHHSWLSDLSPLSGILLTRLVCERTRVADLSPLKDMPLTQLKLANNPVKDLSPLEGMPLRNLDLFQCRQVTDLSPLTGAPLQRLVLQDVPVSDLAPLRDAPLDFLNIGWTRVTDISVLKGKPLQHLELSHTEVTDLTPVAEAPLRELRIWWGSAVTDLSPLKESPLKTLYCDKNILTPANLEVLHTLDSLRTINNRHAADVLREPAPKAQDE